MARDFTPITRSELLIRIRESAGDASERTAARLLSLAHEIGAEEIPAHRAISVRLPVPEMDYSGWLTLYVVSEAGTVYVNWLDRWADAGAPDVLADEYEQTFKDILRVKQLKFHPSAYKRAVPLEFVTANYQRVSQHITATTDRLAHYVQKSGSGPTRRLTSA